MIARKQCATQEDLKAILQDRLVDPMLSRWSEHFEECGECHHRLERLAADPTWWDESREHLSSHSDWTSTETSAKEMAQRLPETLAHYQVESVIGYGGMATVYRGNDPELHRPVAIKVLHPHLNAVGNSRQRFLREAQSAAAIAHPNVIPIYGVHQSDGNTLLVMPLVTGGSLQQRIDAEGPLPLEDALSIAIQIAEGLVAAHGHGVIHRDVKPANILLEDGSRRVLLSDFGLARTLDDATLSASGLIAGTPAFMSPEQARGERIDYRSDLYSLGSVIYAMCTGHAPFHSGSPLRLLRDVAEFPFPSVHRYQEQLPVWVDRLIAKFTASAPTERLQSAREGVELISQCLKHLAHPPQYPLPEVLAPIPVKKPHRLSLRSRKKWLAAVGLVTLVSASLISTYRSPQRNPQRTQESASTSPSSTPIDRDASRVKNSATLTARQNVKPNGLTQWADDLDATLDALRAELVRIEQDSIQLDHGSR